MFVFQQVGFGIAQIKKNVWLCRTLPLLLVVLPLGMLPDKSWEVVAGQRLSTEAISWAIEFEPEALKLQGVHADAEALLLESHQRLVKGQAAQALHLAYEMVSLYPHFQLGQMYLSDLLTLTTDQETDTIASSHQRGEAAAKRLQQLNEEAHRRLTRPEPTSYAGKEPDGLLYISGKVPYVIVVDASRSRLYVMGRDPVGETIENGRPVKVLFESYISVGQQGIGKQTKGDQKTPLGTYVIKKAYPANGLPDLYGSGALTLNYPNDLDNQEGKTGSGIWLHGSPSDQYARPPQASDGCVVLSNPDMTFLMKLGLPAGTPVFIQRQIAWVDPEKNRAQSEKILPAIQDGLTTSDLLAVFSWQEGGRKLMTMTESKVTSAAYRTHYWLKQQSGWRAAVSPPEGAITYARYSGSR